MAQSPKRVKPIFRIYTEGKKTEINYIKSYITEYLKQKGYSGHDVSITQPQDYSPYGLLKAARQDSDSAPGDIVWLIFDCDKHSCISRTFDESRHTNIKIAYSSICFETWILLHFCYSTKAYTCCDEIKKDLNKYFEQGYDKAVKNIFILAAGSDLIRLSDARKNARKMCDWARGTGEKIWQLNPYTNVHELLDAIDGYIANKS